MELLPAIDLRAGTAVRLAQGDFGREERYGDPTALAAGYIAGGARWIHIVDLDGARTGVAHQRDVLHRILDLTRAADVSVEFGGGIRSEDDAADVLESGVARVVLGTAALEEPALAGRCARRRLPVVLGQLHLGFIRQPQQAARVGGCRPERAR